MFERDVQGVVDEYLAGSIAEPQFLQESRPWPRYATDYRPLVEMAKSEGWTVVAANLPRRVASAVAKSGEPAIEQLPPAIGACGGPARMPHDAYFARFTEAMTDHSPPENKSRAHRRRHPGAARHHRPLLLVAMRQGRNDGESVARAVTDRAGKPGPVVHFTGAFHTDFGAGTAERTRRRLPGRRIAIVSMLPVADLDASPRAETI